MLDVRLLADLTSSFRGEGDDAIVLHSKPLTSKNALNQSFDLEALEKYRESVEAQNLNTTYEAPTEIDQNDLLKDWTIFRANSRCIKQECISGQQLLQKIRLDQERRDRLLKLKLDAEDRKRKWDEFDIKINADLNLVKACQNKELEDRAAYISQLTEHEKEYRKNLLLPHFVDFFFDIDENLFPELDNDALNLIRRVWDDSLPEGELFAEDFTLKISRRDLKTLRGLNWLNDEVINFYLSMVAKRSEQRKDLPKTYAFNTFFLQTLEMRGFASVKRWTRKIDLFNYDVVLIPVHLGNHWCLATIDMKAQEINYFDSLGGTNYGCLDLLKKYLDDEHTDKKKSQINLSNWSFECRQDIPRQMNGSDCGVFTCCFAEFSSRRCELKFDQRIMPYYRQRMVYEICRKQLML